MDHWCKKSAEEVGRGNRRKYSQAHKWKDNFTINNGRINIVVLLATDGDLCILI